MGTLKIIIVATITSLIVHVIMTGVIGSPGYKLSSELGALMTASWSSKESGSYGVGGSLDLSSKPLGYEYSVHSSPHGAGWHMVKNNSGVMNSSQVFLELDHVKGSLLEFNDSKGLPRIQIGIDSKDKVYLRVLDSSGNEVWSISEDKNDNKSADSTAGQ